MTTDTAVAESEPDMDEVMRFPTVEDMVIFHNPLWEYLVNATLPVRPPTEAESAEYANRYDDSTWRDLYHPAEPPRIVLPPTPEVAALLDPPPVIAEPEPEPQPPPVLDEHTEGALARFMHAHDSQPAEEDLAPDPKHEVEVHHADTQILYVPRDEPT